jgi:hypothetical protein
LIISSTKLLALHPHGCREGSTLKTLMALSAEAIISIIGVLTNLPPAVLILWNLWKWTRAQRSEVSSKAAQPSLSLRRIKLTWP